MRIHDRFNRRWALRSHTNAHKYPQEISVVVDDAQDATTIISHVGDGWTVDHEIVTPGSLDITLEPGESLVITDELAVFWIRSRCLRLRVGDVVSATIDDDDDEGAEDLPTGMVIDAPLDDEPAAAPEKPDAPPSRWIKD